MGTIVRPEIDSKKLLDFILGEVDESVRNRSEWEALQDESSKRFDAIRSVMSLDADVMTRPWRGASNIGVPVDATAVYTILARLVRGVFGIKPIIVAMPTGPSDMDKVPVIERYMHWELIEEMRVFLDVVLAMQGALVSGSRVGKTTWERDEIAWEEDVFYLVSQTTGRPMFEPGTTTPIEVEASSRGATDPMTGEAFVPKPSRASRSRLIANRPALHIRPIKQVIVSQDADHPDPSRLDWMVDEYWQPFSWFARKEAMDVPIEEGALGKLRSLKDAKRNRERQSAAPPGIKPRMDTKRFHVHEWHGRFEDENGVEHELVALVLPDEKLLFSWVPNEFFRQTGRRQFVHWCPIPRDGAFYGRGIPEMLRGLRSFLDGDVNQAINRGHLFNNPPLLYNKSTSDFDPARHRFGTGVSWGLRDINAVRLLDLPRREDAAFAQREFVFALIERFLGTRDFRIGAQQTPGVPTSGAASKTATGIRQLAQEANIRFDLILQIAQQWTHPELARQVFWHNRFNVTEEKVFAVTEQTDNPFEKIGPEVFGANPDFLFKGNSYNTDKAQEREDVMFLYQLVVSGNNPFLMEDPDLMQRVTQDTFNTYDRPDLRVRSLPELAMVKLKTSLETRAIAAQMASATGMGLEGLAPAGGVPASTNGQSRTPSGTV